MQVSVENLFKLTRRTSSSAGTAERLKKQTPIKIMASNKTAKKSATKSSAKDLRATKGQAEKVNGGMVGRSE